MNTATSAFPASPPRRALKRSASTTSIASLPTPPRTYRRHGRGRSRGSCDSNSESEDDDARRDPQLLSDDEREQEGVARGRSGQGAGPPKRKKRRVALAQDKDDEEAFWLGGSAKSNHETDGSQHDEGEETRGDSDQYHSDALGDDEERDASKSHKPAAATLKKQAPLLYRKLQASASSTLSSSTEQGLLSPPASHRKPVAAITVGSKIGVSKTAASLFKIEESPEPATPSTPRNTNKLVSPPVLGCNTFVDSPSNPFLDTPVDLGLSLSSDEEDSVEGATREPAEKEIPEYDKPTVTYVFRGVKRVYQNPMYDHAKGRPMTPPPNSKLPVTHPLFSPDPTCKPTLLFAEAHKQRDKTRAKVKQLKGEAKHKAGQSSEREKSVVVDSSEEEDALPVQKPVFAPKPGPKDKTKLRRPPPMVARDEEDPFA